MPRLLHTSIFRIALVYLLLLGITLAVLLGVIYWSTAGLLERQTDETVQAEIRGLAEQYRAEGLVRLMEVIRERSGPGGSKENVYLLTGPRFAPLAGNLAHWPAAAAGEEGWLEVELARRDDPSGVPHVIRGRAFDLAGGYHLFVGRDTVERGDFRDIVAGALAWAVVPALLLGLGGGALIGRYSLARVDAVREASEDIVRGDLSRRVPLSGSGDEFDRLAVTINAMLARIETLMGGMRLVTDSLAHDLRSPLTRARSAIDMALRHPGKDEGQGAEQYREALEQTAAELETILRTFEALISIAQAEAGVDSLKLNDLDLSALAGDLLEVYQPIAEDAGVELNGVISETITVAGHRQLLAQALANLLDNAVKYSPSGGRIDLTLRRGAGGVAQLAVADNGPGIPAEDRDRVLQRFVRLDDSRGTPGSGLGLSLVAAVAKLHGAEVSLDDNAPGLRVTLTLPAA
ncbi:HAMP domain-containing sensor histidine kinase [Pelagibius sp. 7325]|uniref:sensor histidine kinase n=1 Tax=Pelagibius sp. 7325 TaxID=3131994 RepID=UPI0030EDADE5